MPKPSEVLKAAGWVPEHDDRHPMDTQWIDPQPPHHLYDFGTATRVQHARDEMAKEADRAIVAAREVTP